MTKLNSILNIVSYALLAVTLFLTGLFYFGGYVEGTALPTPNYTDPIITWGIILIFATSILAVVSEIALLVLRPKNAMRSLISIAAIAIMVFVAYSLGDGTPLNLTGYTGPDNVASMLIMSDTLLYTTYFLFGVSIITIAYSEVSRMFR